MVNKKDSSEIISSLNWRYATKKFDSTKKVDEKDFKEILEAMRLSASSYGLQPWKFLVIKNSETRKKIMAVAWGQSQVVDASHLIVLCTRTDLNESYVKNFIAETARQRGIPVESLAGFEQMLIDSLKSMDAKAGLDWSKKQVYIALGTALTVAAMKKIDTCPMEGFDASKVDEILGLKDKNLASTVILPVGYRAKDDKYAELKKVRFDSKEVISEI